MLIIININIVKIIFKTILRQSVKIILIKIRNIIKIVFIKINIFINYINIRQFIVIRNYNTGSIFISIIIVRIKHNYTGSIKLIHIIVRHFYFRYFSQNTINVFTFNKSGLKNKNLIYIE